MINESQVLKRLVIEIELRTNYEPWFCDANTHKEIYDYHHITLGNAQIFFHRKNIISHGSLPKIVKQIIQEFNDF